MKQFCEGLSIFAKSMTLSGIVLEFMIVLNVCIHLQSCGYQKAKMWTATRVQSYCMDFHRSLSDVSLSLVMDQDFSSISPIIKCQSKIIKLNKAFSALAVSSSQIEPPPKKMKLELHSKNDLKKEFPKRSSRIQLDGAKTVTAVTSLSPLLAFHRVCCVVLLHARKQNHQSDSSQQSKKITVLCGKILLSLEDISNGRYSIKMLRDNSYCTGKWIYMLWICKYIFDSSVYSRWCQAKLLWTGAAQTFWELKPGEIGNKTCFKMEKLFSELLL